MSETGDLVVHPLVRAVTAARDAVAEGLGAVDWSASEDDLREAARVLVALRAQAEAALMAVVGEAEDRGVCTVDSPSPALWLRDVTLMRVTDARAVLHRSVALRELCPRVGAALRAGELSVAHADVLTQVLTHLPARADATTREQAEVFLVEQATLLDPVELRGVGQQLHEAVAGAFPDVDDPEEADAVEREAERAAASAWERRSLDLHHRDSGEVALTGTLGADAAAALATYLDTASAPTPTEDGTADERTATQRRADALTELVTTTLDAGQLPEQGGNRPQILVTVALETLQQMAARTMAGTGDGAAWPRQGTLDTGATLSPGDLRRVLCDARVVPVVLGGASQPLDVGREQRLFTPAMRRAITARDRGCTWAGCRRPSRATQVHHCLLGRRRAHGRGQRLPAVRPPSPTAAPPRVGGAARGQRLSRADSTHLPRPPAKTTPERQIHPAHDDPVRLRVTVMHLRSTRAGGPHAVGRRQESVVRRRRNGRVCR